MSSIPKTVPRCQHCAFFITFDTDAGTHITDFCHSISEKSSLFSKLQYMVSVYRFLSVYRLLFFSASEDECIFRRPMKEEWYEPR